MEGGKLVDSSGKQMSMSIMMPANYSDWVAGGKEVVTELKAAGIDASIDTPQATSYTNATQSGKFDAAFGGYAGTGDPYTDFNNALNSAFAAPVGTPHGQQPSSATRTLRSTRRSPLWRVRLTWPPSRRPRTSSRS